MLNRATAGASRRTAALCALLVVTACGTESGPTSAPDLAKSSIELLTQSPFADGIDRARLQVQLADSSGRPVVGRVVELRSTTGSPRIDQPGTTDKGGSAWAEVETTTPGTTTFRVIVDPGTNEVVLSDAFAVRFLEPPSPTASTVTVSRATAPANGETVVTLTATLQDSGAAPLAGHEVRFDVDDPLATVTQPSTVTDAGGVAVGTVSTLRAGSIRVSVRVNPKGRPMLLQQQPTITFLADALVPDDGEILYGEASISTPRIRNYGKTSGTWSAEQSIGSIATTIRWVVDEFSPTSNHERLVATVAEDGAAAKFSVARQIGDGWVESFSSNAFPFAHVDKRGFDLCFEDLSGDAVAVWSDGSPTLRYRSKTGGTWSGEAALPINDGAGPNPDLTTGTPLWVELVSKPDSNEITLAYVDSNADLAVLVWDGAIWTVGSATVLTTTATVNAVSLLPHNRGFDLAYESASDGLMAAWGEPTVTGARWARRDPSTGSWSTAQTVTLQNGAAEHVDLAADPGSDRIALACFDLGGTERLGLATWNGSAWVQGVEIDSQIRDVNHGARGDWPGEVAWLGTTGVAICLYPDNLPARIDWCRYTVGGGWSASSPVTVSGKGFTESAVLRGFQTIDDVMAVFVDSYGKLWAARYDGTTWTVTNSASPLEPTISTLAGRAFDYNVKLR